MDFLSKNELLFLKNQNYKIKNEINKIIEKENITNKNIKEFENKLSKLKEEKNNVNKELENFLSNKESLEEILKNKINEINNCKLNTILNNVKINNNDILESNKKLFYDDLILLLENLNLNIEKKTKINITDVLNKIYNKIQDKNYINCNFDNLISNFLNQLMNYFIIQ